MLFEQQGGFIWTVIASMVVGNLVLLLLNLPLVGVWAKLTRVPFGIMGPIILVLCVIGAYSVRNSLFDVVIAVLFGFIGYFLHKYNWPVMPLVLCFILGPLLEQSFTQTMAMSAGDFTIFLTRPIALIFLILSLVMIIVSNLLIRRTKRRLVEAGASDLNSIS